MFLVPFLQSLIFWPQSIYGQVFFVIYEKAKVDKLF